MAYNDLINISFEDAVLHANTDNSDILGMILPFHWGPAGEIKVLNQQDFYNTYPESNPHGVILTNVVEAYAQIKSYFANGGSRVAVYRPAVAAELFGNTTELTTGNYLTFKYPGLPLIAGTLVLSVTAPTAPDTDYIVSLNNGASPAVSYETFKGQMFNPAGVDDDGITTYLPKLLEQKSKYMKISSLTSAPTAIPATYTPGVGTDTLASVFGDSDTLIPTQFLGYDATLDAYHTATFYFDNEANQVVPASRFLFAIKGNTSISSFTTPTFNISCNAGVAGAYARVAKEVHTNQVASARSYGAFKGTLTSSYTMSDALSSMALGKITVFNSAMGPQIFGVNNTWYPEHTGSYFGKCNVSRVLAAILRQIIPLALDTIHTDTAANPITRRVFETALNGVINGFISSQDLQSDSKAICDGTNNDDVQTQGGKLLNIILSLHFIGLVEKVNIRVIATDSSVTVNFA